MFLVLQGLRGPLEEVDPEPCRPIRKDAKTRNQWAGLRPSRAAIGRLALSHVLRSDVRGQTGDHVAAGHSGDPRESVQPAPPAGGFYTVSVYEWILPPWRRHMSRCVIAS